MEPGTFRPAGATMTYAWLRNGRAISGATGSSYVPGLRDVGERLSVRVHLSHEGYRDRTVRVSDRWPGHDQAHPVGVDARGVRAARSSGSRSRLPA